MKQLLFIIFSYLAFTSVHAQSDTTASPLEQRIFALHERVMNDPKLQTDHFSSTDTTTLPIGIIKEINGVVYAICIDSAKYTPQGAFFNVYMAMEFPGAQRKIAFAAKNVAFNPKGVIVSQGTKLQLVSEQRINLGPNVQMVFKNDGYNFIEWDCNGYNQVGLSVDFVFNPNILINATNPQANVKASVQLTVQDLQNIAITIPTMDPFRVKGAEDFVFTLSNIAIDRSALSNPMGVVLPSVTSQLYEGNIEEWKGFYAGNVSVKLPPKLSRNGEQISVYAQNLIIDDAGVSGTFGGTNLLTINEANMSGWAFSVTNLSVQLTCNKLTGGAMQGQLAVPVLDDPFNYTASIQTNQNTGTVDYLFGIQLSDTVSIPVSAFSSAIKIHPSSVLQVQTVNNEFRPKAILNGKWDFEKGTTKLRDLAFQNVTIIHTAPVITAGTFSLVGSNSSERQVMRFPISLDQLSFYQTTNNQLKLRAQVSMNLGNAPNTLSVSTGVNVLTNQQIQNGRTTLVHDQVSIDNIAIELNTSPFMLQGVIAVRKDDPQFGDLFYGSISFKINSIMDNPAMVSCGFGKMPDYKYWFTDMAIPVSIPITPTLAITQLYGGVQNRVSSTFTDQQTLARVIGATANTNNQNNSPNASIPFLPDENKGLEFRAGVALQNTAREEVFNGEAMFTIAFNANGGFASIGFLGNAYMMVSRSERNNPNAQKVYGTVNVNYDNNAHVFDAAVDAVVYVPNLLQGNVNLKVHTDPNNWYFWLNRPTNRANLSLVGYFNVNAYFMIGTQVDPLPPPPAAVTNLLGAGSFASIDQTALTTGNGFLTGMQFNTSIYKQMHLVGNWYGYATAGLGAGFDVMLMKMSPTAHCSGSTDPIGINHWYCMGQVYGYLNGGLGAKRIVDGEEKQDIQVISLSTAFLLQGRLPKPTFVYGALALRFQFLVVDVTVNADISVGNDCTIVN